jgi:hypothetical protein
LSDLKDALAQAEIVKLLMGFFYYDRKKPRLWLNTPNPLLGGIKPIDMINCGQSEKLLKFVQAMLKENKHD